jgi:probable F420-dependent oxidoreductase
MRLGVTTFPTDYGLSIVDLARAAEERGFYSLFFNEHTHIPVSRRTAFPGGTVLPKEYSHTHDPFIALAAAAAVTKRIMLGTGICLLVERDPILLAKEVASLDRISNGRVILGIGAGWNVEEMENHGTPYKKRWSVLRERVLAMREIWSNDVAEFHGKFVDFEPLWSWPKPIQDGGPKILLGSKNRRCFERIIEYCDGWMPIASTGSERDLTEGLKMLRARWESVGRSLGALERAAIGMPPDDEMARRLIDGGFMHLIFSIRPGAPEEMLRMLDTCACLASKITDSNDSGKTTDTTEPE